MEMMTVVQTSSLVVNLGEQDSLLKTPLGPFRAPFKDSKTPSLQCFGVDV
jgi:hypothetical protein